MDIRDVEKALKVQGWTLQVASNDHRRYFTPSGEYVVDYPNTASSETRLRNTVAALKRAGLIFPLDKKALKAAEKRAAR